MPMLDYSCGTCSAVYEILTDKDTIKCPECGSSENQNIVPPSCGKPIIH